MDQEQLDNAIEWVNEGRFLDDWLRVNGYTGDVREEAKTEIENTLSSPAPAPAPASKPIIEDDDEIWEDHYNKDD